MAEYSAYPLWSLEPTSPGPIDPAKLPLQQETLSRLLSWSEKYQAQLNLADPASSNFLQGEERLAFEEEGIRLWLQLRKELSPMYEVEYFSESLGKLLKDPSELRSKGELPDE
jgi:hypothetical protein